MNKLMEFLAENPVENIVKEINLNGRLSNFTFKVKALSGKQYNEFQTLSIDNMASNKKRKYNAKKFQELVIINCLVDPNLKDVEFLKSLGVTTPEEAMYKVFLAGELNQIVETILSISGFGNTVEDLEDEVKNS